MSNTKIVISVVLGFILMQLLGKIIIVLNLEPDVGIFSLFFYIIIIFGPFVLALYLVDKIKFSLKRKNGCIKDKNGEWHHDYITIHHKAIAYGEDGLTSWIETKLCRRCRKKTTNIHSHYSGIK